MTEDSHTAIDSENVSRRPSRRPLSRLRYDEHYLTLQAIRGYVGQIDLESLESLDNGVLAFRGDSQRIFATTYTIRRYGNEETIEDVRNVIQNLWASADEDIAKNCVYWLILDSDIIMPIRHDSPPKPLSRDILGTLGHDARASDTFGLPEFNPKLESTELLAKELNIDLIWADIIRQSLSQCLIETHYVKNSSNTSNTTFISRDEIHAIIETILNSRAADNPKQFPEVSVASFPSMQSNDYLFEGMKIRPEHLSSGRLAQHRDLLDDIHSKLKRFGSCAISSDSSTMQFALQWTIVDETDDQRCWFRIESFSIQNGLALLDYIDSYNFNYPIGFIIDDINISSSRLFLKVVDAARSNDSIWVLGSIISFYQYLVSSHKSIATNELQRRPVLLDNESNRLNKNVFGNQTKNTTNAEHFNDNFFEELYFEDNEYNEGRRNKTRKFVKERYAVTNRMRENERKLLFSPIGSNFRTSRKSKKKQQKIKKSREDRHRTVITDDKSSTGTQEEQQLIQERTNELDVLIATIYITAFGGSITIKTLQSYLNYSEDIIGSMVDCLQEMKLLYRQVGDESIHGTNSLFLTYICLALIEEGFTTWNEVISAAIICGDSNQLEFLMSQVCFFKRLDKAAITTALKNRIEFNKQTLKPSSIKSKKAVTLELEDWIRICRGIFHGNLLRISQFETISLFDLPYLANHFVPAIHNEITKTNKRDISEFDNEDVSNLARNWYRKVKTISLPQIVTLNIIDGLVTQFEKLDPDLICAALKSLFCLRLEKRYMNRLRELRTKVPNYFEGLHIRDVVDILDCCFCISKDLASLWINSCDKKKDELLLLTRLMNETPYALPLREDDDGYGIFFNASFSRNILKDSDIDIRDLIYHHSNALQILTYDNFDIVSEIEEIEGQPLETQIFRLAFKGHGTLAMESFSVESTIPIKRFIGCSSWNKYLDLGHEILNSFYACSLEILNLICNQCDPKLAYSKFEKITLEASNLESPADLNWFLVDNEFEFEPLQRVIPLFSKEYFEEIRGLPGSFKGTEYGYIRGNISFRSCYDEPWEHIFDSPPIVLDKISTLLDGINVVKLASETSDISPFRRWPIPTEESENAFSYIVGKSRDVLTEQHEKILKK